MRLPGGSALRNVGIADRGSGRARTAGKQGGVGIGIGDQQTLDPRTQRVDHGSVQSRKVARAGGGKLDGRLEQFAQ